MGVLRALVRLLVLAGMVVLAMLQAALQRDKSARGRAVWMHRWAGRVVRMAGVRLRVVGKPATSGLLVSNHVGYVDVLVIGSIVPTVFVSKAEVMKWPVFGWLTRIAGTIFVNRESRMATASVAEQMHKRMEEGLMVLFFPEGTSSDGEQILPFRTSLFEAPVRAEAEIWTCCVRYTVPGQGRDVVREKVAYWGDMSFGPHVARLFTMKEFEAVVEYSPISIRTDDRKEAARKSEALMREMHAELVGETVGV
ncbi:lysophospholipid acyltransferase family protein [Terriglobus tenax]|uniref:lysophospholipid acyltransferase family protein n=1 Tax=Terriglobus tenax TaxID=1111115 RepID=UPI0021E06B06|nr:lysophospholipid acyltransferase family protein [Terriglobus tenax]